MKMKKTNMDLDSLPMLQPARRWNFELKAGLRSRTAVAAVIATALAALAIISVSVTRSYYVDPSELNPENVSGSFGPPRRCPASPAHTAAHPYNMCSRQPSMTPPPLRWGSDKEVADRICCRNTMWAECEQLISLSPSLRHPGPSDERARLPRPSRRLRVLAVDELSSRATRRRDRDHVLRRGDEPAALRRAPRSHVERILCGEPPPWMAELQRCRGGPVKRVRSQQWRDTEREWDTPGA